MASVANTTYYSISGFSYDFRYFWDSGDDTATGFDTSVSLNVAAEPGAGFSYSIDEVDLADGSVWVDIAIDDRTYAATLEGRSVYDLDMDASIIGVNWTWGGAAHSTVLLELELVKGESTTGGYEYGTRYYFVLDGDAVPDFSSLSEFSSFDSHNITGVYKATGDFGPGELIPWGDVASATVLGADDEFTGGAGDDVFEGGFGDDYFNSSEGDDTYDGGVGAWDQVNYRNDPSGVYVNLAEGTAIDGWGDTDTLKKIEVIRGSQYDDTLIGAKGTQVFRGLGGDDVINGSKGNQDEVRYDRDADYGGLNGVVVNLKKGYAVDGYGDRDTLKNIEFVRGSDLKDTITGSGGKNELEGEGGNDVLKGLGGADILQGGSGQDRLDGGGGNDSLYGEGGADRFIFKGKFGDDVIYDFETAGTKEKIDLSGVKAIKTFSDLTTNHLYEADGAAVIDDGSGNTITLHGISAADLSANDFLF